MDHFMEEVVTKKNRTLDDVMYFLSWALIVFAGFMALMEFSAIMSAIGSGVAIGALIYDIVLALLNGGIAVFVFLRHDRLRTEYEYTFTNGDLDFAQVYNNSKRKSLGSLKIRNLDACGKVSGSAFQRYISMPDVKQSRWFLNRGAELYFFYFQKEDSKRVIIAEPSEELMGMVKQYLPHGAWQE